MNNELFGTDGIRGIANQPPLDPASVQRLGKIIGWNLVENPSCYTVPRGNKSRTDTFPGSEEEMFPPGQPEVILGKDPRNSGDMIESALIAGLNASGANVKRAGVIPTPAISYLTRSSSASCGIMISASHNPAEYNGLKLFTPNGFKLPKIHETRTEKQFRQDRPFPPSPVMKDRIGTVEQAQKSLLNCYIQHLTERCDLPSFSSPQNILIDTAHGATGPVIDRLLSHLSPTTNHSSRQASRNPNEYTHLSNTNLSYKILTPEPDGNRINDNCGAGNPERLQQAVSSEQADLGIAFDGDGDRVLLVDEKGNQIDGDEILAIFAMDLLKHDQLPGNTIVGTVMSNQGLEHFLKQQQIDLFRTPVGDRHIQEKLHETDWVLGGEPSGHIIYFDQSCTGDGLLIALHMLRILSESNRKASECFHPFQKFPQITENVDVPSKPPLDDISPIQKILKQWNDQLQEKGRIIVRYSGTEPVCRITAEAQDISQVESAVQDIAQVVDKCIGK